MQTFGYFEEVIELVNDSPYCLSDHLFVSKLHKAMRAIDYTNFGKVYIRGRANRLATFHSWELLERSNSLPTVT